MRSNSSFIENTYCPSCHSKDNLAIYTDHEWCWSCSRLVFYNYHPRRINDVKDTEVKIVSLPEDIAGYIPAVAHDWIKKYDLTLKELYENNVVWSESRQLLLFPLFDDKHFLWGYQGRYFGSDPKHPKWTSKGNYKNLGKVYHPPLTTPKDSSIILVEDVISAIKISRTTPCLCLFGSFVDLNKICTIYKEKHPKNFIIWLDKDKEKESRLYSLQLNKIGIPTSVISTTLDPKSYSSNEIEQELNKI